MTRGKECICGENMGNLERFDVCCHLSVDVHLSGKKPGMIFMTWPMISVLMNVECHLVREDFNLVN